MRTRWSCVAMLALAACGPAGDRKASSIEPQATPASNHVQPTIPAPATGPDARTPLRPSKPLVDPKSSEAAEDLARDFARLLNERKFDEAYMLLGPNAPPRKDFDAQLIGIKNLRADAGAAGDQQGAAGSIYVSVPLTISGKTGGELVERHSAVVLRRVNDVPGSTEAQRHWHIDRISWDGD